jgi:aspartyl-tRNA(Asn)/glutamyl-tRNA(Gln) amidotransferase subunit B
MQYETVIGLEVHAELKTKSKIFCACSTTFGAEPNANTCPVCLGLPGTLPVLNREVVHLAIRAGKAINCTINTTNKFDRKNYFYPDLPKAYQISQFDLPICENGYLDIEVAGELKRIGITRIHMEEDAGKLIHLEDEPYTLIDYNRTGVPLIEIVSEPDMRSPEEAVAYLIKLKGILDYAEISDCKMEQGSLRCDANISVRAVGQQTLNTKVEIKNMNSFKEILKALQKEEKRQRELYSYGEGEKIRQETRRWDTAKGKTVSMRSKEDAHDYRYFPDPDIPPVHILESVIKETEDQLPELPFARTQRFIKEYQLTKQEVETLILNKELADYFEEVISYGANPKEAANWILVELLRVRKETETITIRSRYLAELIGMIEDGIISRTAGKVVFEELLVSEKTPKDIAVEKGLSQISGTNELEMLVATVISQNPGAVLDFKNGKPQSIGYLMGQIMKASGGKANPQIAKATLDQQMVEL